LQHIRRVGSQAKGRRSINHFNPLSNFHLSLGINYPNASDKILSDKQAPGGSIYIHGNCVTVGCIPVTDDKIKELYVLTVEAKNNGQDKIPVHIFPSRLDARSMKILVQQFNADVTTINFWKNLQNIYNDFESSKGIRPVHVNNKGEYFF
jgi:murein L,D-transpeptidase YafK